ncbi:MAG: hypothetical protein JWL90_3725 [Chthoniobacteraceae bacterium]|nr:hypothetical protein [Chthoniobacteraceae bacterium]
MHTCPVCAYPGLQEPPHSASGGGSYEICPCCGFQFGVDDEDKGLSYEEGRQRWVNAGMKWSGKGVAAPEGWDPGKQLAGITKPERTRPKSRRRP